MGEVHEAVRLGRRFRDALADLVGAEISLDGWVVAAFHGMAGGGYLLRKSYYFLKESLIPDWRRNVFDQIGGLGAEGDCLGGIWLILEEIDDRHSNKEVSQASLIFPLTWSLSKQVLQPLARVIHLAHRFGILFLSEEDLT